MSDDILTKLKRVVGDGRVVTGERVSAYEFPWATHDRCLAKAFVYPASTEEVSKVMALCNEHRQVVVPFGGTTNLVQGCATAEDDIVLSLKHMADVEELDSAAQTLSAGAGLTLQAAQEAANKAGLYFPVDIGARSSCTLGGIVSTNAGGTKVIRYGMTRDSVLGLEVVLADGTVLTSMNRFIKNNSGFDLKQMFIGSEGVLGIVTRVIFRLAVKPQTQQVALLACDSFDKVVATLHTAQQMLPATLTGFEVMWNSFYRLAVQPKGRLTAPLEPGAAHYILLEAMGSEPEHDAAAFEAVLESLLTNELLTDGVIAKSDRERADIWAIRDEVEPVIGNSHNFDVSLKSADAGAYVATLVNKIPAEVAGTEVVGFGHLGDNNVHVSVQMKDQSSERIQAVEKIVYEQLLPYDGAISAEHGIGIEKRAYLPISRTVEEIDIMRRLKRMLDPNNILNPGKVVDAS
ncbi:MAG TPA: FAD-binding oxidoreductase [Woeseiaceae bacterium]|nr:FAD-binding oxidoreductase [Woeseiaceae bacterium]